MKQRYAVVAVGVVVVGLLGVFAVGVWQFANQLAASESVTAAVADNQAAQAAAAQAAAARAELDLEQSRIDLAAYPEGAEWRARAGAVLWVGGAVAVVVLLNGLAIAGAWWAWRRASVIFPDSRGQWPVITYKQRDGALAVIDVSRFVSPALIVAEDGQFFSPVVQSDAAQFAQLEVTRQAQAAQLMRGIVQPSAVEQAKRQLEKVTTALPLPTFGDVSTVFAKEVEAAPRAVNGDRLRFVYVRKAEGVTEASRDLQDIREFIELIPVKGLARRLWLAHHFSSGHDCTRARYDALITKLSKAGVIVAHGQSWQMNVPVESALGAFGLRDVDLDVRPAPAVVDVVRASED